MIELKYRNVKFHVIVESLHNSSDGYLLIGNMEVKLSRSIQYISYITQAYSGIIVTVDTNKGK